MQVPSGDASFGGGVVSIRSRLASPWSAALLGGLVVGLTAAATTLTVLTRDVALVNDGMGFILVLVVTCVGAVLARHRPENPIGWLMLGSALLLIITSDARLYAVLAYHLHHGRLPLAPVAVFLGDTSWVVTFAVFPVMILLFPDGKLPSPRWRWCLWAYIAAASVVISSVYLQEASIVGRPFRIDPSSGQSIGDAHLSGVSAWISSFGDITALAFPIFLFVFVGRQVVAWRRARGEGRQQLKWLMGGAAIAVLAGLGNFVAYNALSGTVQQVVKDVTDIGVAALAVSIGVAVHKYRLYEIDRLISRTLTYALLTGMLVGVFVALVVLLTDVLPFSSPVAVAASTLAAAALFNPLRRRTQHLIDRRFDRARYDAQATVAAFSGQLRDAVDLDTIMRELLTIVDQTIAPTHASLWIGPSVSLPPRAS